MLMNNKDIIWNIDKCKDEREDLFWKNPQELVQFIKSFHWLIN